MTSTVAAGLAAVLVEGEGSGAVPSALAVATIAVALVSVGWVRQRPIRPGDAVAYANTAVIKIAIAEMPALVGLVLAVVSGSGWPAILGLAGTAIGLVLSWPSEADRERHELLYLV